MVVEGEGRGKGRGGICIDLKFSNPFATPVGAGLGWSAWVGGGRRRKREWGGETSGRKRPLDMEGRFPTFVACSSRVDFTGN